MPTGGFGSDSFGASPFGGDSGSISPSLNNSKMLEVTKLYAVSFDLDHMDVFWAIKDFNGDINRFTFQVLRSESPMGPWDQLTPEFKDKYYFRDVSPSLLHKWRKLFYLLRIKDLQTSEVKDFGPTAQQAEPDLIALEIMRQEDVLFRGFVGRKVWLFPVRTFGVKCICFDRTMGRRTKSNCLTCMDTGYAGGFLSPIECFLQIDPSADSPVNTPMMKQQPNDTSGRMISFPPVKPDDIIIEAENKRWRVIKVAATQRLRANVHQELTLHEIPKGDVEYNLPVNLADLTNIQPSDELNFTNPQHNDPEEDYFNSLAVYGYNPRGTAK